MSNEKKDGAIEKFQSSVLTAAADAVVKEMSPEKMRACAEQVISVALKSISAYEYGPLGSVVTKQAEKMMLEFMQTPEIQAKLKKAVKAGIESALDKLPAEIQGKVTDTCVAAVGSAVARGAENGRRY